MAQLFGDKMPVLSYQKIKAQEAAGKIFLDHYVYVGEVASIAAGATVTLNINVEADSSFILDKLAFMADLAGAAQTDSTRVLPLVAVSIKDTGSGRDLQSQPVPITSIAGNGELPFVLPQPRVFTANSTITLTFRNDSAATTYENLTLSLIGRKVFND